MIYIYTYVYTWTLVNEVKHHESNLTPCWAESEGSQNGFPQSQWSDSLTKRSAGSVPLKVPFPWWFSQRRKNTSFWVGAKKTCLISILVFFWRIIWSWRDEGEQLSFTFSSWQSEDSRVTIVLEFSLITTLENQRYHWNDGDLMAFY